MWVCLSITGVSQITLHSSGLKCIFHFLSDKKRKWLAIDWSNDKMQLLSVDMIKCGPVAVFVGVKHHNSSFLFHLKQIVHYINQTGGLSFYHVLEFCGHFYFYTHALLHIYCTSNVKRCEIQKGDFAWLAMSNTARSEKSI